MRVSAIPWPLTLRHRGNRQPGERIDQPLGEPAPVRALPHGATLLVAELGDRVLGYLLGFDHPSFFANGPVAWVEELAVQAGHRRHGLGSLLMEAFEVEVRGRGVRLVALATTRAGGFYLAIGYTEHAAYFRKLL